VLQQVIKRRSSRGQAQIARPLGTTVLRHKHSSFMRFGAAAWRDLAIRFASVGQQRGASKDARAGGSATAVRL
jgi:hypothetical protein